MSKVTNAATAAQPRQPVQEKIPVGWGFIKAQRYSAYTLQTAMAELVDNAIDAGAKKVSIRLHGEAEVVDTVVVMDNGGGMGYDILRGSYKLGAGIPHERNDLGKFGLGGTTSCISQATKKETWTIDSEGILRGRSYDLADCKEQDSWVTSDLGQALSLYDVSDSAAEFFEDCVRNELGDSGTIITIRDLDLVQDRSIKSCRAKLLKHLGETYCDYITKDGLEIQVDGKVVVSEDPLCLQNPLTRVVVKEEIAHKSGAKLALIAVDLLDLSDTDIPKMKRKLKESSGGYIFRNYRQIIGAAGAGDSLPLDMGFPSKSMDGRYFRWKLEFNESADEIVGINFSKNSVANFHKDLADQINCHLQPAFKAAVAASKSVPKKNKKGKSSLEKSVKPLAHKFMRVTPYDANKAETQEKKKGITKLKTEVKAHTRSFKSNDITVDEVSSGKMNAPTRIDWIKNPAALQINIDSEWAQKFCLDKKVSQETQDLFVASETIFEYAMAELPDDVPVLDDLRAKIQEFKRKYCSLP